MRRYISQKFKLLDKWIAIPFFTLILFSILMDYSASSYSAMKTFGNPNHYLMRQIFNVVLSLILASVVYLFPFRALKNKKFIIFGTFFIFLLLLAVFFFKPNLGARRWIPLGFIDIQPSEFAKLFVIWYLAYIFSRNQRGLNYNFWVTVFRPVVLVTVIAFLIYMQPDTGTAIILALMVLIIVSASGAPMKYGLLFITGTILLGSLLLFIVYTFGEDIPQLSYRYDRFLGLWDPFRYQESHGHQLVNSYYALNRGGFFGVGIGNSIQKTGYLPFPYTDFIVAIVGEEFGLIGIFGVLASLGTIIGRSFYLGSKSKDSFNGLIFIGVASMLLIQSLVNLAGILGIIPISGVTFPILSYGGSSIMAVSISIALISNASRMERTVEKCKKQ
ncbi:MAG: FtsW/RodA/SpoVE family cell cycle protein [Atopostipes suicloacalis]|nr:FtsW/RodA/SpoVE family cell cycle protein [Atopostipes suicloacalis]